ncbi:hypothetical protein JCM8097_006467 [Rhodosporidiobolus ruineniae]
MLPHPARLVLLLSALASLPLANALFSQGTISDRDYQLTYSSAYNDTTAFCTAFRAECVDYVGALNYHHNLDCVVSQAGPTIYAWCGGVEKDADGDTGSGPAYDFTTLVCPETNGCSIAAEPKEPVAAYGSSATASAATSSAASSATSSKAAPASATKSESSPDEVLQTTPPSNPSSLVTTASLITTYSFASQARSSSGGIAYSANQAAVSTLSSSGNSTSASSADAESAASWGWKTNSRVLAVAVVAAMVARFA